jgi:phthiocerol/phenolphthiocerol synthesis type-I polyketide synthase E
MENSNNNIPNKENNFDIAIIGISGRFPGANSVDEFWQNLCSGVESISFFSDDELKESGVDPAVVSDPHYVKASPLLDGPEMFDASFFRYSPKEARFMDPQHRIFLECAWEALEHAGYDADRYEGPIGVYAGASMNTYLLFSGLLRNFTNEYLPILIGSDKDFLTTRVSYKLNLKGPSVAVQSACSTSLVAVHIACQSLLNAECDMALAGGVSIRVPHKVGYFYQEGGTFSPDGHCRAFDAKAKGMILGSGVGIVVLKRLADAMAAGDCIHAIIKGSAINNDGSSKSDYTAPSVNSQSEAIIEALANSGIEADTISYVEAHGTGTALGDPIEIAALTNAFHSYTDKKGFCAIGSVKTNIGHLDVAAGIAGLIKTILALKHKIIPPSLNFEKANPEIDFDNSPFYVNSMLSEWKANQNPRRAGVSALGVGGTNAHLILEEAPNVEPSGKSRPWQLLLLSGKTSTALDTATKNLANHLKQHPKLNFADSAYTLQVGRKAFKHRRMAVCRDSDDAVATLETLDSKRVLTFFEEFINRDVVFIFSGQGSQYVNMGLELYRAEPRFQEQIDRCSEILTPHLSFDLRDILYPEEKNVEEVAQKLNQTFISQPALFTIEYALAKLWMSWGVHPQALVGHSIGEYVAACIAGAFSLEDALSLVATRGRLMQELPGGSMLAVFLSEREIQPLLCKNLSLAAINGPSLCVVSGEKEAVDDLEKQLSNKGLDCRHLHTSHAFHSRMMEPILDAFSQELTKVSINSPQIPFVSNVTGTWITPDEAMNVDYWAKQLRQTVRFSDCIQELLKEPNRVFLEVGPGHTFSMLVWQYPNKTEGHIVLSSTRHPKENESDVAFILNTLGRLWTSGVKVNWYGFYQDESRHRVPLPTYPFERKRYWSESGEQVCAATSTPPSLSEVLEETPVSNRPDSERRTYNTYDDPSRNEIEQVLANIWKEALGIDRVSIHDNFFDLGGTSLIALRLFALIEKKIGRRLPLAALFPTPTIEKLANALRQEEEPALWHSLIALQPDGSHPPLFGIHSTRYHTLARYLGPEQPIYALRYGHGSGTSEDILNLPDRIEDLACHYIEEMQTVRPKGPYFLIGLCIGGLVAFEMAQQLLEQNEEIALLVLADPIIQGGLKSLPLRTKVSNLIQMGPLEALTRAQEKAVKELRRLKAQKSNRAQIKYHKYVPQKIYPGKAVIFKPVDGVSLSSTFDPELGWGKLVAGGLEIHEVPSGHTELFEEPPVRVVAEILKDCLAQARADVLARSKVSHIGQRMA